MAGAKKSTWVGGTVSRRTRHRRGDVASSRSHPPWRRPRTCATRPTRPSPRTSSRRSGSPSWPRTSPSSTVPCGARRCPGAGPDLGPDRRLPGRARRGGGGARGDADRDHTRDAPVPRTGCGGRAGTAGRGHRDRTRRRLRGRRDGPRRSRGVRRPCGAPRDPVLRHARRVVRRRPAFLWDVQNATKRLLLVTGISGTSQEAAEPGGGPPATADGDQELIVTGRCTSCPTRRCACHGRTRPRRPCRSRRPCPAKNPLLPIAGQLTGRPRPRPGPPPRRTRPWRVLQPWEDRRHAALVDRR